jgi:hypothetical protein
MTMTTESEIDRAMAQWHYGMAEMYARNGMPSLADECRNAGDALTTPCDVCGKTPAWHIGAAGERLCSDCLTSITD